MLSEHQSYDVIVIGGGPAGSTAATLVAQQGLRVLLAERSTEPQFKIGESLIPATYWTLQRLGMIEKMRASHFPKKYSVQFFNRAGRASQPFYFYENDPHESSQTWQVKRSEFDQLLLDNAAEHGVEVRRGLAVTSVLFDGDRARGVRVQTAGGESGELSARVVVDATGQSALIANGFGLLNVEPNLKNVAYFSHFEGALRDPGIDEGATIVFHTTGQEAWFWYIPLPDDVVSVGVVGPVEHLVQGRGADPQRIFEEELANCPPLQPRLANARQAWPIKVRRDFSYRSRRVAGEGWVLVGDAFNFIDPIYSTGVLFAFESGELAADAIVEGLAKGDLSAAQLGGWGDSFFAGVDALRKLVYAFYDKDFRFSTFIKRFPEHRRELIDLLTGNVFPDQPEAIFEAIAQLIQLPETPRIEASALDSRERDRHQPAPAAAG